MARFAVEKHENREMASIHFDFEVPRISWCGTESDGERAKELQSLLLELNGVTEVTASGQRLRITRGGVFTWDELIPRVLEAVEKFFEVDQWNEVEVFA